MASYLELFALASDSDLQDRMRVAVVVAADAIRTETSPPTNQAERLVWAAVAMANPVTEAKRMLWAVLATNKDLAVAQITGATDEVLQANVDAAVDLFAGGV